MLFFEIERNKVLKISKRENISMELGKKYGENFIKEKNLNEFDENTRPDITNKIASKKNNKSSKIKHLLLKKTQLKILKIFLLIIIKKIRLTLIQKK